MTTRQTPKQELDTKDMFEREEVLIPLTLLFSLDLTLMGVGGVGEYDQ